MSSYKELSQMVKSGQRPATAAEPAAKQVSTSYMAEKAEREQQPAARVSAGSAGRKLDRQQRLEQQRSQSDTVRKRNEAQQLYDSYVKSDEYKQNLRAANQKAMTDRWMTAAITGSTDTIMQPVEDQKEKQLRAMVDHYNAQVQKEEDQKVMDSDFRELEAWDEQDRAALQRYIMGQDTDFANRMNPMTDPGFGSATVEASALIQKYGLKRVNEMAETLRRSQNEEAARQAEQAGREGADSGFLGAAGHNAASVGANAVGGLTGLMGYLQELGARTGRYATMDPNNIGNLPAAYAGGVRSGTAENIAGDVYGENGNLISDGGALRQLGAYAYQGGMSAADSMARAAMGGGAAGGAALAATGSFTQTLSKASAQGATPGEAAALATATAGIEYLSEKIPLDNLVDAAKAGGHGVKEIVKNALLQGGIEATTEEISLIGTTLAEAAILKEKAGYRQRINELVAGGVPLAEAQNTATMELLKEAGETAVVSFLSGGMSEAGASVAGNLTHRGENLSANGQQVNADADNPGTVAEQVREAAPALTEQEKTDRAMEETAAQWAQELPREEKPEKTEAELRIDRAYEATMGAELSKTAAPEEATVTVRSAGVSPLDREVDPENDQKVLAHQLATNMNTIQDMESVSQLTGREFGKTGDNKKISDKLRDFFKSIGNRVTRSGFGEVDLGEYAVGAFLTHRPINRARAVSVAAAPDVIKNGRQIGYEANWKGRGYPSYVFAAPVDVAGSKVYVAAVVNQAPDNKFYLSEMIDSEGNYVRIEESSSGNSKNGLPMGPENQQGRNYARPEELSKGSSPTAEAEPMPLSENIVPQQRPEVNGNIDEGRAQGVDGQEESAKGGQAGIKGTGAAEANFSGKAAYQDLLTDDNVQPDRPGDVRPMEVPKKDSYGRNVSEFAANAYGAAVTSDRMANEIEQLIQDGALGFDRVSNEEALNNARDAIYGKDGQKGRGESRTMTDIRKNIYNGKIQDGDIEKALLLYAKYANRKSESSLDNAAELMVDLTNMAHMTGRNLQLFKLLRRMTPEGQLLTVQRSVERHAEDMIAKGKVKKGYEPSVDQGLMDDYLEATKELKEADTPGKQKDAERKVKEAEEAIYAVEAAKMPATFKAKWDAWRYMCMLGNAKTQVRNLGGNLAFLPYKDVKDAIGAGLERAFIRDQSKRTKAVLNVASKADRQLLAWAKADRKSDTVHDALKYSAKLGDDVSDSKMEEHQKVFDTKALEAVRKAVEKVPAESDLLFKNGHYERSLAGFLKARGYTAGDLRQGLVKDDILNEARNYAIQEAMKATFNDCNAFSDFMSSIGRNPVHRNNPVAKAMNVVGEAVLPFRRTPANIVVRFEEYSPLGLINTAVKTAKHIRNGDVSAAAAIDSLASSFTGSGVLALGFFLAKGIGNIRLTGSLDDEDEKRQGRQEYAVEFSLGGQEYSYKIDWAAPANLPLFVGANLYNLLANAGNEDASVSKFTSFLYSTATMFEPMLSLSCLSSLNDLFETGKYSDGNALYSVAAQAATSYLTQGIPSLAKQTVQAFQENKQTTFANSADPLIRDLQRTAAATGIVPALKTDAVDEWGRVDDQGIGIVRALNAFLNPGTLKQIDNSALEQEITRLNDSQPDSVSPPDTPKTVSYTDGNGNRHTAKRLTEQEYTTLVTVQGQTAKKLLDQILKDKLYGAMTDEQKASVFQYVYDYAREKGRTAALPGYQGLDGWMKDIQGKEADGILNKAITNAFTDAFEQLAAGSDEAAAALDQAYGIFGKLPRKEANAFAEEAGGRVKYFIGAKRSGIDAKTFTGLYQQFREIDENPDLNTSGKAAEWSYKLEKAQEAGTITRAQKESLKDSMVYYQMFPAETVKFDQMTENGISADKAMDIGKLMEGITPQEGYTNVRDVQKAAGLAKSSLSREEKTVAMKVYLSDAQDENLDLMLALGYSPEDFAAVWEIYANEKGTGKKARTINKIQDELGVDRAAAKEIYSIYN